MLPGLACVLIYSLTKRALEDGFKDSCCENFVIFAERYSRQTLLLRNLQYVESRLF